MNNLVIVESPAKAKTIQKYLGKDYSVIASMGHIRDLPKSKIGVDIDNNFQPRYEEIKGKESLIAELKKAAKASDFVYLATDPDREGEAISWHLAAMLDLPTDENNRVTFNEITKSGILKGMEHPRSIDMNLVDAQQARRILDRIVGYKLSPFLWRKVRRGLSAGRVQSVAVRLISDRENEIKNFKPREYWSLEASLKRQHDRSKFKALLSLKDGKKLEINNAEEAEAILKETENAQFIVSSVKKAVKRKNPPPPFTTSTLQQEASRKLGFQAKRTMKVAQELYEGIDLDKIGAVGLITYMRTDSLRVSADAQKEAEEFIGKNYSKEYLPSSRRVYKSKGNAQDAHEAVRPTMPSLTPSQAKASLTSDQFKLYKLIWERFIASQMASKLLNTSSVDIKAGDYTFKASGFSVKFDGYSALYEESTDDKEEKSKELPPLEENEELKLMSLDKEQHFTAPPPRYSEASLIKSLEENGIGRPSTYAPTITTILARGYVERSQKNLIPTPLGEAVTELLKEQFKNIVNVKFTASMEEQLDMVETGDVEWVKTLDDFYKDFSATLSNAEKNMEGKRVKVPAEETDVVCELCGRKMVIKVGRFGKFLACPGFPECKNTKKIVEPTKGNCPVCGKKIIAKKSKKGRTFYGCEGYPDCNFMTWDLPLEETCPKCGKTLFKKTGRNGIIHCLGEGCDFSKPIFKKDE